MWILIIYIEKRVLTRDWAYISITSQPNPTRAMYVYKRLNI